jgi:hypothetical protein
VDWIIPQDIGVKRHGPGDIQIVAAGTICKAPGLMITEPFQFSILHLISEPGTRAPDAIQHNIFVT